MHNAEPVTGPIVKILSGYRCHDYDYSSAYMVQTVCIFVFFPFVVFQSRLPLEDRALKLMLSYILQNIKRRSCVLFLPPNYSVLKYHNIPYTPSYQLSVGHVHCTFIQNDGNPPC